MKTCTIKANNTEYRLLLSAEASLDEFARELKEFATELLEQPKAKEAFDLIIDSGNRILPFEYKQLYTNIIESRSEWSVLFTSNVLTKRQALKWHKNTALRVEFRTVEAGDILEASGDLLLVGDIEPGGFVRAAGNIYIIGRHDGVAYAGASGNDRAVIVGTFSTNSEIRINRHTYSIRHTLDEKSNYTPRAYFINERGVLEATDVTNIEHVRPEIDTIVNEIHHYEG